MRRNFAIRVASYVAVARIGIIAFVALAANALLLLSDGVFWDAWIYRTQLAHGQANLVLAAHVDAGLPLRGLFYLGLMWLPGDVGTWLRVLALAGIACTGVVAFALALRSGLLSRNESLFIACVAVAYPALHTAVSDVIVPLILSQLLVLVAVWIACVAEDRRGIAQWALRGLTVVLLLVAFEHKATIALFVGVAPLAVLALSRAMPARRAIDLLLRRRAELVALPVVYFAAAIAIFPQRGLYAAEYSPTDVGRMALVAVAFLAAIGVQIGNAIAGLARWPVLAPALVAVAALMPRGGASSKDVAAALRLAGAAGLWLAAAVLPYVVIGRMPAVQGWDVRHLLPVAIPLAVALVGLSRPARALLVGRSAHLASVATIAVLGGFVLLQITTEAEWLARWATDRATIAALAERPELRNFSVFVVDDPDRIGGASTYEFYEWSAIFERAWGDERWYGRDESSVGAFDSDRRFFGPLYLLSHADPDGCRARMLIRRSIPTRDAVELGFQYAYARLTGGAPDVNATISVKTLPSPHRDACPSFDEDFGGTS